MLVPWPCGEMERTGWTQDIVWRKSQWICWQIRCGVRGKKAFCTTPKFLAWRDGCAHYWDGEDWGGKRFLFVWLFSGKEAILNSDLAGLCLFYLCDSPEAMSSRQGERTKYIPEPGSVIRLETSTETPPAPGRAEAPGRARCAYINVWIYLSHSHYASSACCHSCLLFIL